jgi:hypothetical protein
MDAQELRNLQEAYNQVYELEEGKKPYPAKKVNNSLMKKSEYIGYEDQGGRAERESERGERQYQVHKKMMKKEEVQTDLFDYILEHLVAEGYADTNEAAIAIMANMSEEWRESIVEEIEQLDEISQKTATRAFAARATDAFEADDTDAYDKAEKTKARIVKKHGAAAGQHAERAAHAKIFGRGKRALTSMPPKP